MEGLPLASVGKRLILNVTEMPYFVYLLFAVSVWTLWALELLIRITLLSGLVLLSSYVAVCQAVSHASTSSIRIMLELHSPAAQNLWNMAQRQSNCSYQRLWSSHFPIFACILVIWRNPWNNEGTTVNDHASYSAYVPRDLFTSVGYLGIRYLKFIMKEGKLASSVVD